MLYKKYVSNFLRSARLLTLFDRLRFLIIYLSKFNEIREYKKKHAHICLPPAYLVYESFDLNYSTYFEGSYETARWLLNYFAKYKELDHVNILDWGCGPARIVRHLPLLLDTTCQIHGTDYNSRSIEWCSKHIKGVSFNLNNLNPPLPYIDNYFDIIYGISIFTHLPEYLHYTWFEELERVSKNDAIIFLTSQGDAFKSKLTENEINDFEEGNLIEKGNTKVGHRTFSTYHSVIFLKNLFKHHEILEHIPGIIKNSKPQQDVWIIKVRK